MLALLLACSPTVVDPGKGAPPQDTGAAETAAPLETAQPDSALPNAEVEQLGSSTLRFDPEPGLMDAAFTLAMESDLTGASVVYTLDGTDPRSSATAQPYAGPLDVEGTTVVRAALLLDGATIGAVQTGSWIFPDQVADQQAPDSWPATWFEDYGSGPYQALYTLCSDVTEPDPEALVEALRALPVMSLVLDPSALWGPSGIYDHAWEEGTDWERAVHIELLNSDETWAADAGLRTYGGASRNPTGSPKKSFRVVFRSEYGPSEMDVALYGEDPEPLNSFILRAGYNHTWVHWDPEQRSRAQYLRDRNARETQRALGWAASRGVYVHLYLDGVYWGIYDLTERPDAHFFAANYGEQDGDTDAEDWDVLNSGDPVDGDEAAWDATLALARADTGDDASLAALEEQVDSDALIDYMLMNFYLGNTDWPYHNWYVGRARSGGRWRVASWDAEHTLEDLGDNVTGVSDTGTPAELWAAFLRHPSFVARVLARADEILGDGGPLSSDESLARMTAISDVVRAAVLAESARWGNYRRDVYCYSSGPCPLYTVDDWDTEHERLIDSVVPDRTGITRVQLAAHGWATSP